MDHAKRLPALGAADKRTRWAFAESSAHVLGLLEYTRTGVAQPGSWCAGAPYPEAFVTTIRHDAIRYTPKEAARLAKGYRHYRDLCWWVSDAPPEYRRYEWHPRVLRWLGLDVGHFVEMRELAERFSIPPIWQITDLVTAAEAGTKPTAMRYMLLELMGGDARPDWKRAAGEARPLIGRILDDNEAPDPWCKWAEAGRALVEELEVCDE